MKIFSHTKSHHRSRLVNELPLSGYFPSILLMNMNQYFSISAPWNISYFSTPNIQKRWKWSEEFFIFHCLILAEILAHNHNDGFKFQINTCGRHISEKDFMCLKLKHIRHWHDMSSSLNLIWQVITASNFRVLQVSEHSWNSEMWWEYCWLFMMIFIRFWYLTFIKRFEFNPIIVRQYNNSHVASEIADTNFIWLWSV